MCISLAGDNNPLPGARGPPCTDAVHCWLADPMHCKCNILMHCIDVHCIVLHYFAVRGFPAFGKGHTSPLTLFFIICKRRTTALLFIVFPPIWWHIWKHTVEKSHTSPSLLNHLQARDNYSKLDCFLAEYYLAEYFSLCCSTLHCVFSQKSLLWNPKVSTVYLVNHI